MRFDITSVYKNGFFIFRILDITKPWPIRYFDKQVHGGVGIMLDDIVAGVISLTIMQILIQETPIGIQVMEILIMFLLMEVHWWFAET